MPIIIETEDGRTFGPGQPYGYQGQYQGQRQPGIETANMRSVPQRTIQDEVRKYSNELPGSGWTPDRGDFARRFRNPDTTTVPVGPEGKKIFNDPDRFGRMRPTVNPYARRIDNNPMGGANIGGGWNQYEGGPGPRHYFPVHYAATMGGGGGGNPFDPGNLGMDSGEYLSSMYGGDLDGAQSERGALLAGEGFGQGDRIRRLEAQGKKVKKILESKYGVNNPIVKQKLAQYFDKMRKLGTGIFQHGVTKGNPLLNIMELLPEGVIEQGFDELNELTDPGVQTI